MADNLSDKGFKLRAELWGDGDSRQRHEDLKKFDAGFADFLNEQVFGAIWTRPGLPTKTRSFITMAALMALGRTNQLRTHMQGALHLGITPAEIKETHHSSVAVQRRAHGGRGDSRVSRGYRAQKITRGTGGEPFALPLTPR